MSHTPRISYGSWPSPISADLIVAESIKLSQIQLDGDDIYWVEQRPSEGGRNVIVKCTPDGRKTDITPQEFNARTRVHEYGGGAYCVHDGTVYFSNFADQRIYTQVPGSAPKALSADKPFRFADYLMDTAHKRLICVLEDHSQSGREPNNALVGITLDGGDVQTLAAGMDFYASPALSPDGQRLAWISWNHPNMPWDGSELWVAEVSPDGTLAKAARIAGGEGESIFQPQWSPDGTLYFVSDRSNWWNLHRWNGENAEPVLLREAEFGLPQWVFGMSTYGFTATNDIICTFFENGRWCFARIHPGDGTLRLIETPFCSFDTVRVGANTAVFIAGADVMSYAVVAFDLETNHIDILRRSAETPFESTFISRPEVFEFPTEGGLTAHAFFYAPQNRDVDPPDDERPPLIVKSHGGPTGSADTTLDLKIQFWTSRGFAVLDVNYGGSTGYGRAYRERLLGKWGIVDVDDCINGAKYLIAKDLVDADRVIIAGGSAGGYTTLCALTFRDFFKAGASYYGVSDLEALAKDTHKFESHYLDRLVGPYPERRDIYLERSPIHFTEKLSCPVIIMQGLEDKIVPPNQAEMMVNALKQKGLPVAYLTFAGEQHGFRKASTIKRSLEAELYFYSRIFHFDVADDIEPVEIFNLKD